MTATILFENDQAHVVVTAVDMQGREKEEVPEEAVEDFSEPQILE